MGIGALNIFSPPTIGFSGMASIIPSPLGGLPCGSQGEGLSAFAMAGPMHSIPGAFHPANHGIFRRSDGGAPNHPVQGGAPNHPVQGGAPGRAGQVEGYRLSQNSLLSVIVNAFLDVIASMDDSQFESAIKNWHAVTINGVKIIIDVPAELELEPGRGGYLIS